MSREQRIKQIKEIERKRNSKLICYITGDRRNFETRIAKDVIHLFHEHLSSFGKINNFDLLIYSTGGDTLAAFTIVNHIREFCNKFSVLIPYRALSAATLISLGADEIYMTKLGELSPIDPSITTPYNPVLPNQPPTAPLQFLPVSVEDVLGYINFAKRELKVNEEKSLNLVLQMLTEKVHPLSLGHVFRANEQIGMLAKKLLEYHMQKEEKINNIIKILTKELYSHDYCMTRSEVKEKLKLNVIETDNELERMIWELYKQYRLELELDVPFSQELFLGNKTDKIGDFKRVYLESVSRTDVFLTKKRIQRTQIQIPNIPITQPGYNEELIFEGWTIEE